MILKKIKSICIVGNAYTIVGRKLGEKIDAFPWVARFSAGLPEWNQEHIEDIGEKTDIYINRGILHKEILDMALERFRFRYLFTDITEEILEKCKEPNVGVYQIDKSVDVLEKYIPNDFPAKGLSTGMAFIGLCLKYKIPDIRICGFTTEENYIPNQLSEFCLRVKRRNEINQEFDVMRYPSHDFKLERSIRSRLIREKRIKLL